jgi:hypothetical protein
MSTEMESLSDKARLEILAGLAHELTICARDTYEVGTDEVRDPRDLRAYNELLHRVTASVVSNLAGSNGFPLESVVEMVRSFGVQRSRVKEMEWVLERAFKRQDRQPRP